LVLVAGSDFFGNSAPCERNYKNQHSYDAHAILPWETVELLPRKSTAGRAAYGDIIAAEARSET
jgi:hypothetical protein